jgi:signal transduction histidine kinase
MSTRPVRLACRFLPPAHRARPPWVRFRWGDFASFKAVVEQLELTFTYFSSRGSPLRANAVFTGRVARSTRVTGEPRNGPTRRTVVQVERVYKGPIHELTVDDDGLGLRDAAEGGGILGMRERAALLGGSVETGRSPRGGTRITARLPWEATT